MYTPGVREDSNYDQLEECSSTTDLERCLLPHRSERQKFRTVVTVVTVNPSRTRFPLLVYPQMRLFSDIITSLHVTVIAMRIQHPERSEASSYCRHKRQQQNVAFVSRHTAVSYI
jgi:hypothetical protein